MIISVLVQLSNKNIDKTFDYIVPNNLRDKIKIGIRVSVPFSNQMLEGFILSIKDSGDYDSLKEIIDVIDDDVILNDELLELGKKISEKTLSTLIMSYQVMLPKALKAKFGTSVNKRIDKYVALNDDYSCDKKFNSKQQEIINFLLVNKRVLKSTLNSFSASSLNTLIKNKVVFLEEKEKYRYSVKDYFYPKYELTDSQKNVSNSVYNGSDSVYLIHGVTGSGKTEVYMDLIEKYLNVNKTAIVLVPEISLTPQMINRFSSRFKEEIAVLHSGLSEGEKYDEWRRIARGEVKIVIGARSAIFAPLKNIGIIIIDEEHTSSYKQDNNPKYSAIDVAIMRSNYYNCKVVLGSATPTLESYARAKKGVYKLLELPNRVNNKSLPEVNIVDMTNEYKKTKTSFSPLLESEINRVIENGEQVILLLNRRGYSSFVSCKNCGNVIKCPNCDITLTYHKTSNTLRCHYCGYGTKKIDECPSCHEQSIIDIGNGTEKVEEEINKCFKLAKVIRMDFDTTSKKGMHEAIIEDFRSGKYNILLGTQMIAKGLDFPNVTLVGVINADTSLNMPDFRSSEYTFQLLSQVAGRAGRASKPGKVIIQTFNPDHYAIEYAKNHDYKGFYNTEMEIRRKLRYSPYYYMVNVKVLSGDYQTAMMESNKVSDILKKKLTSSIVLGPSVCNVFKVNNVYRFGIIIKYKKELELYKTLEELQDYYKSNNKVKIDIDFNPNKV